jgi:hypothetical protein
VHVAFNDGAGRSLQVALRLHGWESHALMSDRQLVNMINTTNQCRP